MEHLTQKTQKTSPFSLSGAVKGVPGRALTRIVENVLERVFSLKHLSQLYSQLPPCDNVDQFMDRVLQQLNIRLQLDPSELARVPAQGALIVVANHPFGALEGVLLASALRKVRPDVRVMANFVLERLPELRELFISVDPFSSPQATRRNVAPLKESIRWLQQGGVLVIFPAGEVSHLNLNKKQVIDPPWHNTVGRIARLTQAPVLSAYFHGSNSMLFQLAGFIHPLLRTSLLPRELLNKQHMTIPLRFSRVMSHDRLRKLGDPDMITDYLRLRTYMLRYASSKNPLPTLEHKWPLSQGVPVAEAGDPAMLQQEVSSLAAEHLLHETSDMAVYVARASRIPALMYEIARQREICFRAAGEGTGRMLDVDFYDNYYLQLFVWHKTHRELVGAYRLGLTDEIVEKYGINGLYSHSLFAYTSVLTEVMPPMLELGRSFIRREYQKSFAPLLLLWKGIARFVVLNPRYRVLFGPVSISADYLPVSRQIMMDYLLNNHRVTSDVQHLVRPRQPVKLMRLAAGGANLAHLSTPDEVSELIAELEPSGAGLPVLLRQYLKLGGRIWGFNMDTNFNQAIDGLIMVDLLATESYTLEKYMGAEGFARFYQHHCQQKPLLNS